MDCFFAKCQVGVRVCLEKVHQEYGKHIIDEQIHASLFGQEWDSADGLLIQLQRDASGMRKAH